MDETGNSTLVSIQHDGRDYGHIILNRDMSNNPSNPDVKAMVDLQSHKNGGDLYLSNANGTEGISLINNSNNTEFAMYSGNLSSGNSNNKVIDMTADENGGKFTMTDGGGINATDNRVSLTTGTAGAKFDLYNNNGSNSISMESNTGISDISMFTDTCTCHYYLVPSLFIFFWLYPMAYRILSSPTRNQIWARAEKALSPHHWTAREFPEYFNCSKQKPLPGEKGVGEG
jgi:hypothetical protein